MGESRAEERDDAMRRGAAMMAVVGVYWLWEDSHPSKRNVRP